MHYSLFVLLLLPVFLNSISSLSNSSSWLSYLLSSFSLFLLIFIIIILIFNIILKVMIIIHPKKIPCLSRGLWKSECSRIFRLEPSSPSLSSSLPLNDDHPYNHTHHHQHLSFIAATHFFRILYCHSDKWNLNNDNHHHHHHLHNCWDSISPLYCQGHPTPSQELLLHIFFVISSMFIFAINHRQYVHHHFHHHHHLHRHHHKDHQDLLKLWLGSSPFSFLCITSSFLSDLSHTIQSSSPSSLLSTTSSLSMAGEESEKKTNLWWFLPAFPIVLMPR